MRFQLALLALPFLAMAYPQGSTDAPALPTAEPVPQPPSEPASLRSGVAGAGPITCALTGSDVRYRTCPSTDNKKCPAVGQYGPAGTKVAFKCFTYGESVYGNVYWDQTTQGYYVSEYYVNKDCAYKLPQC